MKEKTTQLIIDSIFRIVEANNHSNIPLDYDIISNECYAEKSTISHICDNYLNCKIDKMHPVELCCWISAKEHILDTTFRLPDQISILGSKTFMQKPKVFCLLKSKVNKEETIDLLIKFNPLIENIEIIENVNSPIYLHCIIHFLNSADLEIHSNSIKDLITEKNIEKNKIQQDDSTQKQLTRKAINKEKQYSNISSNFKIKEIKKLIDKEEKKRKETLDEKHRKEEYDNSNKLKQLFLPLNNIDVKRIGINNVQNFFFAKYFFPLEEWIIKPLELQDISKRNKNIDIVNIHIDLKKSNEGITLMIMYHLKPDFIKRVSKYNTIKDWCKNPLHALSEIDEDIYSLIEKK